jgi:putative endonuclease
MGNERPTLYTGVTSNLVKRVYEHKIGIGSVFTSRYKLCKLLYFEQVPIITQAIVREKQIKDLDRKDKLVLIKSNNPNFVDLYSTII